MDYKDFIKKGSHVIWHGEYFDEQKFKNTGAGWVKGHKHVQIISQARDDEGKFTSDFYWDEDVTVNVKDENGKIFQTAICNLEPDFAPGGLSNEDLKTLWNEMGKGSIYYADYRNSVGIFEETAYNFFEGYADENWYDLKEEYPELSDEELEQKHWDSMNAESFAEYCKGVEYLY